MQGEGQEFESPRLHHSPERDRPQRNETCTGSHPTRTEEPRVKPETTLESARCRGSIRLDGGPDESLGPSFPCLRRKRIRSALLIRGLRRRTPTSRSAGGAPDLGRAFRRSPRRPHLTNWICVVRQIEETSISPSCSRCIPDPPCRRLTAWSDA